MKNRIHLKAPGNWINDPNGFIEVFVNNGEYVISNVVYGLKKEIHAQCMEKLIIETLES